MSDKKMGAPSKFDKVKAYILEMAKYGLTDAQMADVVGVTEQTLNNWKKKDPEFFESLKAQKIIADLNVSQGLYKKATGHITKINKAFKVRRVEYENGKRLREYEEVINAEDEVYTPPDTTAAIYWTKNRQPDKWRDKQQIEHSGQLDINQTTSLIDKYLD